MGELNLVVPFKTASSWSSGKLDPGQQTIEISNGTAGTLIQKEMELINGADYMLVLTDADDGVALNSYIAVGGGSVSILWQLPQYAVITVGTSAKRLTTQHILPTLIRYFRNSQVRFYSPSRVLNLRSHKHPSR